jgi:hypothetical protein
MSLQHLATSSNDQANALMYAAIGVCTWAFQRAASYFCAKSRQLGLSRHTAHPGTHHGSNGNYTTIYNIKQVCAPPIFPCTPYNCSWALESPRNWRASRNQELAVLAVIHPEHCSLPSCNKEKRRIMAYAYLEEHFCSWEIIMIIALAFVSTSSQSCALPGTGNMNGSSQPPIEHLRKAPEYIIQVPFSLVTQLWISEIWAWRLDPFLQPMHQRFEEMFFISSDDDRVIPGSLHILSGLSLESVT